jgi:ABC-type Fe3+/spermidine/putrescine transport system ATPase subunit
MTNIDDSNLTGLLVENITKTFDDIRVLDGISFHVDQKEIITILGPSGCGKSTLLNIIAGLTAPETGHLSWDKNNLLGIPTHKRGFGLMFQDYLLFPHKNVGANIAFGLQMSHWSKKHIGERVDETLKIVGLEGYAQRDVNNLSGGEQQRVALARALAPHPKLLMLDEPLSSIDRALRDRLMDELRSILKRVQQTAIYVTHDQQEALMISDRVIVMNHGKIEQIGTPQEIYQQPATEFVARFLGFDNIFEAQLINGMLITEFGNFDIRDLGIDQKSLSKIHNTAQKYFFRPDSVRFSETGMYHIQVKILNFKFRGSHYRVFTQLNQNTIVFNLPATTTLPPIGETISLSFLPEEAIHIFKEKQSPA